MFDEEWVAPWSNTCLEIVYILAKCFQEENSEDVNGKTQFLIPMLYHLLYSVCVSHDYFFLSI